MELCLGLGFSYLLVRNSPISNNEVDWFSLVLGFALSCYMVVVLNGRKFCIEKMIGFKGDAVRFF